MDTRPDPVALDALIALTARDLDRRAGLVVIGLSGAQGSGKSTLAAALHQHYAVQGLASAVLSLDDLYHTRAARLRLAEDVHPLLVTRGVPGTHDVALGLATIAALARGEPVLMSRFDKARDDRRAPVAADRAPSATRLLIVEGWCLGARPQTQAELATPVNALEADEDRDGRWRGHVNKALAGDYATLWARLDALAMLRAPDFAMVATWRRQQEHALRASAGHAPGVMTDAELDRFIAHYERITRHMLTDLPTRADLVIELDANRRASRCILRLPGA